MRTYENMYCKVFINYNEELDILIKEISKLVDGKKQLFRTIQTEIGVIDVNKNEDFDTNKSFKETDGFIYSKYYLDVEPNESIEQEVYISWVIDLMKNLRENGISSVIACDFEDKISTI